MFKKTCLTFGVLLGLSILWGASTEIETPASVMLVNSVGVSTNTATAIYTGSTDLVGRTKIVIKNADATYDVFIGTHSGVTVLTGFKLNESTDSITLPLGSNFTLYGLGEANASDGTIDLDVIEIKQ